MSQPQNLMPAFPVSPDHVDAHEDWRGMTLRDYFAAKAMAALIEVRCDSRAMAYDFPVVAREAYQAAEAMLVAREE